VPFWSGPKRAPSYIEFNVDDDLHLHYVSALANLVAANLKIDQVRDETTIRKLAEATKAGEYVHKVIKVKTPEEEKAEEGK